MISRLRHLRQRSGRLIFTPQHALRRLTGGLIIGVLVAAILSVGLWEGMFNSIRTTLTDSLYQPRPTTGIISIVAIDDASLAAYGRTPVEWPRSIEANLVRTLSDAGARVIVFDVLFANPSPDDADLAAAMQSAGDVVQPILGSNKTQVDVTKVGQLISYDTFDAPTPDLAAASSLIGHANVVPDQDGQVRRVPLVIVKDGQPVPALALAAYMQYLRIPTMKAVTIQKNAVLFAGRTLYTDGVGRMMIYFFGPPSRVNGGGTFPAYSLVDVVEGRVPPEAFKDRIVLIGAMGAPGVPDNYATPSSTSGEPMYGVEIHANIIETIHQSLKTVPQIHNNVNWAVNLGPLHVQLYKGTASLPLREQSLRDKILITAALAVLSGITFLFLRWYVGLLLAAATYAAYFAWASASFTARGLVVELMFPAVALSLTYLSTMIFSYVFEERRRGQINDLFSRYVSPEIAQKIVEAFDKGKLELGGEEREITVLFADIRGFTTLSEGLSPPEVVHMLNIFLNQMTMIVMEHGGAINKYIGDNLMAFWNAPYPQEDHAWLATKAGLEMLEAIQKLNDAGEFQSPVQFGIGVNTGPVVVGNIGSQRRLEYTPIGDTVNTASRLCGVAPGGTVYVGRRTYDLINGHVEAVAVHNLKLKGKAEPVEIFELRPDFGAPVTPQAEPTAAPEVE